MKMPNLLRKSIFSLVAFVFGAAVGAVACVLVIADRVVRVQDQLGMSLRPDSNARGTPYASQVP